MPNVTQLSSLPVPPLRMPNRLDVSSLPLPNLPFMRKPAPPMWHFGPFDIAQPHVHIPAVHLPQMHMLGWRRRSWGDTILRAGGLVILGAILMYFFDPERGNGRRKLFGNEFMGMVRRQGRHLGRLRRKMQSDAYGKVQAMLHVRAAQEILDDATLAHKVESILFRDPDIPKGNININCEYGVVFLRGTCDSEAMIQRIVQRVEAIDGIREVHSLLHLSGTPAP